jgi:hypothetical protein
MSDEYEKRIMMNSPVMKGLAAVSREPRPFPMIKIDAQKPPNDFALIQGIAIKAPTAYKHSPQMKTALYE